MFFFKKMGFRPRREKKGSVAKSRSLLRTILLTELLTKTIKYNTTDKTSPNRLFRPYKPK